MNYHNTTRPIAWQELCKAGKPAAEKYQQAITIKPDMHDACDHWGLTHLDESIALTGNAEKKAYEKAKDMFRKSKAIANKPDNNLACLYAMTGRPDDARKELHGGKTGGTLPDHAHLSTNPDIGPLQGLPEFITLLASIEPQE